MHLALTKLLKLKANAKLDIKLICVLFLVGVAFVGVACWCCFQIEPEPFKFEIIEHEPNL